MCWGRSTGSTFSKNNERGNGAFGVDDVHAAYLESYTWFRGRSITEFVLNSLPIFLKHSRWSKGRCFLRGRHF